MENR
jgi:hypothetical protein